MVKHVILWQLKGEYSEKEKEAVKNEIKRGLEGLKGVIAGLIDIHVQTKSLPTSNADVMLDATFESEAALKEYAVHPEHVKVADGKVRPYVQLRTCMDFEIADM